MSKMKYLAKPLTWFVTLLVVAFAAGCGNGNNAPIMDAGGATTSTTSKAITAFSVAGATGVVNEPAKTIAVTVPNGTNVTALVATFAATGVSVKVGAAVQTSAVTANNFTSPVAYIVTAADASTATYTVTVTVAAATAKALTGFSFAGYTGATGVINEPAKTIAVTVPFGTDVTTLVATFATTGATVKVGATVQTSTATANDFTSPVAYIVTAGDASTATYTVSVTVAANTAKAITSFSFAGYTGATGVVNEVAKTIAVTVPFGTDVTALVATFATTGVSVKVGAAVQTSAATANNFSSPVVYIVTAANASTVNYTVTVTVAANTAKAITAFSFAGYTGATGVVNEVAKTIAVTVPNGTDVTALVATFVSTGVSVKVGAAVQTSAATANNFTSPVVYIVTAADASTVNYTVTVTVAGTADKAITAYSILGVTGVINEPAKTIAVLVPAVSDVTTLVATFTTTGVNVKVGAAVQTSTATQNDFTAPVVYTVTAGDTTTVDYTVTVTLAAANPTAPTLGEAGRFVIFANQAITTTGVTAITNGDIGITPAARTFIAGFTPTGPAGDLTELTGTTWVGMASTSYAPADANPAPFPYPLHYALPHAVWTTTGAMLTQASTDVGIANTFLNADPNPTAPTQVLPTELGTLTMTRGVYKTASNVGITTGTLTLDAQGDPNAVFIFVIGGTLTTGAPGGSIVLANGAEARNVFWTTAGVTTIGAGTIFYGSVFAATQVNVLAGAQITGSLFGISDRVTLIADTVTKAP
ncbi:MAG: ice-binding family protein [Sideroxydans sp.]|jgi:hypothetical protein